ncbi:hypothetical protein HMF3257_25670 [Spirosoma telluris]|uniref:Uncharacterized protein n=1 Tax=Spirosoma telluris TaxID=2183553 RepID=A0A327NSC9_9BACT|nr:hypothetical protein HMF3257_25670 [Spirosoma telluris]
MVSERVSRLSISLFLVAGFLTGFIIYCAALIHCVKTISGGNFSQAIWETAIVLLYTILGIRFGHRKMMNKSFKM